MPPTAWLLAVPPLAALAAGLLTFSPGPAPGLAAVSLAQAAGMEFRPGPQAPLWFGAVRLLLGLPSRSLAFWPNLLSLACSVLSVGLLTLLLYARTRQVIARREPFDEEVARGPAILAALTGGCMLAFVLPCWRAANRAHPGVLALLFLLAAAAALVVLVSRRGFPWGGLAAVLWAAAAVEEPLLLPLALPLVAVLAAVWARQPRRLAGRLAAVLGLTLAVLAGLSLLAAALFLGEPAHRLAGSPSLLQVVLDFWRGQAAVLAAAVRTPGWLLAGLATAAPCAAGLLTHAGTGRRARAPVVIAFNLLLTAGLLAAVLNAPCAPWLLANDAHAGLPGGALAAAACGLLVSTWWQVLQTAGEDPPRRRSRHRPPRWPQAMKRLSFPGLAALCGLLVAATLAANLRRADARAETVVDRYAHEVVASLDGRPWLVASGNLDASLQLAAWERRQPLRVLNIHRGRDRLYMDRVAGWFDDPRLRHASRLGSLTLVREWFASATNIAEEVAFATTPDLLQAAGLTPVPHRLVYVGVRDPAALDGGALLRAQRGYAGSLEPLLAPRRRDAPAVAAFRAAGRTHLSRLANDLGVLLAGQGRDALACEAYREARRLDAANISALLNLGSLAAALPPGEAAAVASELATRTAGRPRPDWWSLARQYGFVQRPEAHAALGRVWALSGQPALLVSGFRRALESAPAAARPAARRGLAAAYRMEGRPEASREVYDAMLRDNAGDAAALLGLARLDVDAGRLDQAAARLQQVAGHDAPAPELLPTWAGLLIRAGDLDRARVILQTLCEADPEHLAARAMLTGVAIEQRDGPAVEAGLRELRRLEGGRGFHVCAAEALQALSRGDPAAARTRFKEALSRRPASTETLERILRLDHLLGPEETTEHFAARLVSLDPRSALGAYTLGAVKLRQRSYAAARVWLERSVALSRTPAALNDLAWVLAQEGEAAQGEVLAREALQQAPRLAAAWDTLAETLVRQQRPAEATEALRRAVALDGRGAPLLARLAGLVAQHGSVDEARTLLAEVARARRPLPPDAAAAVREAEAWLRRRGAGR